MTYHYRIYTFQNGFGNTVFRAKRAGVLPAFLESWIEGWDYHKDVYRSIWESRDIVMEAIKVDAISRFAKKKDAMREKLKLIVVEDQSVDVT